MAPAPAQPLHPRVAGALLSYCLGSAALLASTAAFVWADPAANGPAATVLSLSVALDALSRLAADAASRRSGVTLTMRGLPSVVLPLGAAPALAAAILLATPVLIPGRFPVVASLIAGLVAMGALARLSLVRRVLSHAEAEKRDTRVPT